MGLLDRLKKAYKKADVKLGGYLPGGKTPKQVKAEKAKPKKPVSKAPKEFTGDKVIDVARVKHEPDKTVIIQPGTPDIRIKVPETKRETEDLKRAQRAATIPKSRITKGFESAEERLSGFREVPSEEGIGEAAIKTAPRFAAGFAGWFAAEGAKKSRSVEITLAELRRGRSFKEASRTALAEVPISTIKKEDIAAYNPFQEGISPGERLQRTSEAVFILGGAYRSTKGRITPGAEKASPKFRPDVRVIVPTSKGKVVSVVDGKRVVDVPYSYSIRTPSQRLLGSEGKFGAGAVRIATKEGKAKFVGADIAEGRYVYGREAGFQLGKFDPSVSLGASRTSTLGQGVKLSDIVGAGAPVKRKLKVRAKRTTPESLIFGKRRFGVSDYPVRRLPPKITRPLRAGEPAKFMTTMLFRRLPTRPDLIGGRGTTIILSGKPKKISTLERARRAYKIPKPVRQRLPKEYPGVARTVDIKAIVERKPPREPEIGGLIVGRSRQKQTTKFTKSELSIIGEAATQEAVKKIKPLPKAPAIIPASPRAQAGAAPQTQQITSSLPYTQFGGSTRQILTPSSLEVERKADVADIGFISGRTYRTGQAEDLLLGSSQEQDVREKLKAKTRTRQIQEDRLKEEVRIGQLLGQEQRQKTLARTKTLTEITEEMVLYPPIVSPNIRIIPPPPFKFKLKLKGGKYKREQLRASPLRTPSFTALAPIGLIKGKKKRKDEYSGLELRKVLGGGKVI